MILAFAVVVAQSCVAFLPPPTVQIDWSRNGQPYARDVPVSSSVNERVYRRSFRNGTSEDVTRVLSCSTGQQGVILRERVGADDINIPVELRRAQTVTMNGATIRRIDAPVDAQAGSLWFSVSRYGPQLFGLRDRVGIEEIRTPAVSGRVEVLRAVLTPMEPAQAAPNPSDEINRRLNAQLALQERTSIELRDSIAALLRELDFQQSSARLASAELEARAAATSSSLSVRAAQLIADSAVRLPSADAARAAGWAWPGAGHAFMDRNGAGWMTAGVLGAGVAVAGAALPESVLSNVGNPDQVRIGAVAGGAAFYLLSLLVSHTRLERAIGQESAVARTREAFLRAATVDVTAAGELVITIRKPAR